MLADDPSMRRSWLALGIESVHVASATRVVSGLMLLLSVAVPAGIMGTVGLNIEAQASILRRVDESGARIVTMTTTGGVAGAIPAGSVARAAQLEGVSWVLGLGPVFDGRNRQATGGPTPVRAYRAVDAPVTFSGSGADGAFLSAESASRLGLAGAYSEIDPGPIPIVGWFAAREPLDALNAFVLVPSSDDELMLERLVVAVEDVSWVDAVALSLPALVGMDAARLTSVERGAGLIAARQAVRDEVARRDRLLVAALLGVATAIACVVVFAGTIAGRKDFGRRRALGATQLQLSVLVMLASLWPAAVGGATGAGIGWFYLASRSSQPVDGQFPLSVGVLTVLLLVTASAIPAAIAATRDPLRVLRVP
jgi:putative ABC transport system permease protein